MQGLGMAVEIIHNHPLIDGVLGKHAKALGRDVKAYRGHVFRMFNAARWIAADAGILDKESENKLAVAAAFHDLGIWTAGTFDYLKPSEELAAAFLSETGRDSWILQIVAMIATHHKITRYTPDANNLIEVFRRADLLDLSLGLFRSGVPKKFITDLDRAFANAGFHRRLIALTFAWWPKHPLKPLPMSKW